jgi:nucleoside-diphosphate-sugar epimerase
VVRVFLAGADRRRPGRGPFDSSYTAQQKQRLAAGEQFVALPCSPAGEPLGRTLVQREDVVDGLAAMVGNDAAANRTFHLSGPAFSYRQPCEYLAGKLSLPIERVTLPDAHSFEIDYTLTTDLLGWSPKFDVIAMLDAALAWRAAQ